ncbi:hypothetical protein KKG31_08740, partial [Patescibacteria group bacterium]|nr:hypothetical protein [Patescibacteria group bacterium]
MEGIVIKEDLAGMAQKIQERRAIRYGELKLLSWLLLWPIGIVCLMWLPAKGAGPQHPFMALAIVMPFMVVIGLPLLWTIFDG